MPLTQHTLRVVTGIDGLRAVRQETQRDLKRLAGARSVELDVWAVDSQGRWHDIEVRRGNSARPRRARYHSAAMDVEALGAGDEPEGLPEQWVIFLMEGDPFGRGAGTYLFRRREVGVAGLELGDGTAVLYVNGAYEADDELGRLVHDFRQSDPDAMLDPLVSERVRYLKRTPEGVRQMCEVFEEIRREGIEEGERQGSERRLLENLRSLMANLQVPAQEAMRLLSVPEDQRARYMAML